MVQCRIESEPIINRLSHFVELVIVFHGETKEFDGLATW